MTRKSSRGEHKTAQVSVSQNNHWCHFPSYPSEFPCLQKVIQEKNPIAKQSKSVSLVKPIGGKKSETSIEMCPDLHKLSSLVSVSLYNPGEYLISDLWKSSSAGALSSVQSVSHVQLFATPWLQHAWLPCPSPTPGAYSNSCPLSWWCHANISSSVVPFSSHNQSFPTSGSFQRSQFFTSGGQSIGVSASASVLPMNIQDWFPLGWTGWISFLSKALSRVFFNTTVKKHLFFSAHFSL